MTDARPEPIWLTTTQVRVLHAESLELFGGARGIRDPGLLESALSRPVNKWMSERTDNLFERAASYAFGIARNHPFVDGNKRTSLLTVRAFLFRNGHVFSPDEVETVTMIEGLAGGTVDEAMLVAWIEANSRSRR